MTNSKDARKSAAYNQRTPIHNQAGRVCGWFDERTKVLTRRWLESHRVKAFDAIAYDAEVLAIVEAYGCQVLENTNPETGHVYRCAFAVMRAQGIPFNFGYGDQVALPLRYWVEFDADGRQVEAAPAAGVTVKAETLQIGLFDGVPA